MVDGEKMLISVIVPVYNTNPRFIEETLASTLLLKNLCTYEVIIVNDGSTDEATLKFLNQIDTTQFQIIHQQNGGTSSAKNTAIRHAQGEYILPLDSDDRLNAEIIYFIDYLKETKTDDIIYGDLSIFGDKIKKRKFRTFHPYELILIENKLLACSLYKKSVWEELGGYDESFRTCEDWDFWCRCAYINKRFHYLPYSTYDYRIIKDGNSLLQQTQHLVSEHQQRILAKMPVGYLKRNELIDFVNERLRYELQKKKTKAFAMLIYSLSPKFYTFLCKLGLFKKFKDNFFFH